MVAHLNAGQQLSAAARGVNTGVNSAAVDGGGVNRGVHSAGVDGGGVHRGVNNAGQEVGVDESITNGGVHHGDVTGGVNNSVNCGVNGGVNDAAASVAHYRAAIAKCYRAQKVQAAALDSSGAAAGKQVRDKAALYAYVNQDRCFLVKLY